MFNRITAYEPTQTLLFLGVGLHFVGLIQEGIKNVEYFCRRTIDEQNVCQVGYELDSFDFFFIVHVENYEKQLRNPLVS